MPERETLREALEDIRRKLRAGAYQNEEQVRLALVAINQTDKRNIKKCNRG